MEEAEALPEAEQLKSIAEAKFKESNYKSALKIAKRAQRLSPNLDGISSMVTAFKILRTANKGPNPNWYKVLQVELFAHINTIRTKYKKLALLLHPDKNTNVGSEEAFKLVSEAFRFLSDRIRRKEYDLKLRVKIQDKKIRVSVGNEDLGLGETFWTACSTCRLLHQFERRYLGYELVCPCCRKSFEAVEVESGGDDAGVRSSVRLRKMGVASERKMGDEGSKATGSDGDKMGGRLRKRMKSVGEVMERSKPKKAKVDEEMMTLAEMKLEVKRKAQEQKVKEKMKAKEKDDREKNKDKNRHQDSKKGKNVEVERSTVSKSMKDLGNSKSKKTRVSKSRDFYDFNKDRVERSFKKGQVWAIYDGEDGLPRNYGLVDEVVSVKPFEVEFSWLDPQDNGDELLAAWEKMRLPVPCGRFNVDSKTSTNSVHIFSHEVDSDRVAKEIHRIYPKKGSVWALHNEVDLDAAGRNLLVEDKLCYDVVVCLTSYSEIHGLSLAYLEKVDGFNTVFKRREIGSHAIRCLEKDDVRLLSHQIPARKLSGDESPNLVKDCWELDPASIPLDLLTFG